jgi:hypothetical protein
MPLKLILSDLGQYLSMNPECWVFLRQGTPEAGSRNGRVFQKMAEKGLALGVQASKRISVSD